MEYEFGYFVDNVWHCGCCSLNAANLKTCPVCNKPNPKNNE